MSGETQAGLRTGDSDKNTFIEVWRGIAVALVVYFHFPGRLNPGVLGLSAGPTLPFYSGKVGVLVFFAISGFLITQSLAYSRSLASFYAKRLSRIWPLFILAATTTYLVGLAWPAPSVAESDASFSVHTVRLVDYLGTLFFLNDLGLRWVDGAYWSILIELKFYLFIGIFAAIWPGRFARRFGAAAFAIGFVQLVIELAAPPHVAVIASVMNRLLIADYVPFFAIGVLLCAKERGPLLTLNILLAFIQTAITVASNPLFEADATLRFILVFSGVLAIDAALLGSRLFLFLGRYSYSIYVFHQMIGLTIVAWLAPRLGIDAGGAVALAAVVALAVAGSWAAEWRFRDLFYERLRALFARMGLDRMAVSDRERQPHAKGSSEEASRG